MVCSIKKMGAKSWEYYLRLIRYYTGRRRPKGRGGRDEDGPDDEYPGDGGFDEDPDFDALTLPGEPPGLWMGKACSVLGVYGFIRGDEAEDELRRLFEGYHPKTGAPLVQNAGRMEGERARTPGWDVTFSAPKSFSVFYSAAPRWLRDTLDQIQERAVKWTVEQAEDRFAVSRVGRGGQTVDVDVAVATFPHHTSRARDCQLHTHCLFINIGVDKQGKTRALESPPLFENRDLLGSIYRARLAWLLQSSLGLELERDGFSFRIKGVPQDLCEAHSTRRREIEEELQRRAAKYGVELDGKAAAIAALATRAEKGERLVMAELLAEWQTLNAVYGFTAEKAESLLQRHEPRGGWSEAEAAVKEAIEQLTYEGCHFSGRRFFEEVLNAGAARGVSDTTLLAIAPKYLQGDDIECLGVRPGETSARHTTRQILGQERRLLDAAYTLRDRRPDRVVPERIVQKVLSKRKTISAEQSAAVRHLLQSSGCIRLARGFAGVGKTAFVLEPAAEALERAGYEVLAATPTGKAARVLAGETGIDSDTITMRLVDFDLSFGWRDIKHHLRMVGRVFKGRSTWRMKKPQPIKITPRTALIVDESGMVNTRHMAMIAERVARGGGLLILVGDPAQLPAIEGSSPFQSLCTRLGSAEVRDIKRQEEQWARDASLLFADGKCGKGLQMYADRGFLRLAPNKELAMKLVLSDWTEVGVRRPEEAAILVGTNVDAEQANDLAQKARLEAGYLRGRSVPIRDVTEDATYESSVRAGDRVVFTRNSKKVANGTFATVQRITGRRTLVVRVPARDGKGSVVQHIDAKHFPHIRRGYATTTHKFQGDGVRYAFCLVGGRMQDQPLSYVQASRAKRRCTFYASEQLVPQLDKVDKSPLVRQMERRPDLCLASDLLEELGGRELQREAMIEKLLDAWQEKARRGRPCAIIAPTRRDAIELNRRCQQRRIQDAVMRGTDRLSFDGHTFMVGDRIGFRAGCFRLRARQGDMATIVGVDEQKMTLQLQLDWAGPGITKRVTASMMEHAHLLGHAWVFTGEQAKDLNGQERIYWDTFFRDHFWTLRGHSAREAAYERAAAREASPNGPGGLENDLPNCLKHIDRVLKAQQSSYELRCRARVAHYGAANEPQKVRRRRLLRVKLLHSWRHEVRAERRRIRAGLPQRQNPYPALSDWALALRLDGEDGEWEDLEAKLEEATLAGLEAKHRERAAVAPRRDSDHADAEAAEEKVSAVTKARHFGPQRRRIRYRHRSPRQQAHYDRLLRRAAAEHRIKRLGEIETKKLEAFEQQCSSEAKAYHQAATEADRQAEARRRQKKQTEERQKGESLARQTIFLHGSQQAAAERRRERQQQQQAVEKQRAEQTSRAAIAKEKAPKKRPEMPSSAVRWCVWALGLGVAFLGRLGVSAAATAQRVWLAGKRRAAWVEAELGRLDQEQRGRMGRLDRCVLWVSGMDVTVWVQRRGRWLRFAERQRGHLTLAARWAMQNLGVAAGVLTHGVVWVAKIPYRIWLARKQRAEQAELRLRREREYEAIQRKRKEEEQERKWKEEWEAKIRHEREMVARYGKEEWSHMEKRRERRQLMQDYDCSLKMYEYAQGLDIDGDDQRWESLADGIHNAKLWRLHDETMEIRDERDRLRREQAEESAEQSRSSGGGRSFFFSGNDDDAGSPSSTSSQLGGGQTPSSVDYNSQWNQQNADFQQSLQNGAAGSQTSQQANPPTTSQIRPG